MKYNDFSKSRRLFLSFCTKLFKRVLIFGCFYRISGIHTTMADDNSARGDLKTIESETIEKNTRNFINELKTLYKKETTGSNLSELEKHKDDIRRNAEKILESKGYQIEAPKNLRIVPLPN